jgi:low temperature requirement protein LtrA
MAVKSAQLTRHTHSPETLLYNMMFLVLISVRLPKIFQNTMIDILLFVNGAHLRAAYYGPGQDLYQDAQYV